MLTNKWGERMKNQIWLQSDAAHSQIRSGLKKFYQTWSQITAGNAKDVCGGLMETYAL